jgi:beta-glucosidase
MLRRKSKKTISILVMTFLVIMNLAVGPMVFADEPEPVNLALNKTATASSSYWGLNPNNAVDGNMGTNWRPSTAGSEWVTVDLGEVFNINKVVLHWYEERYGRSYSILVSTDNENWDIVYDTTTGAEGTVSIAFPAVEARYVKLDLRQSGGTSYRLNEFEIYNIPDLTLVPSTTSVKTPVGIAPVLPEKLPLNYSDGSIGIEYDIIWDEIDPESYAQAGTFTVSGTIEAGGQAVAYVTVMELNASVDVVTYVGHAPELPQVISVYYTDGTFYCDSAVTWDEIDPESYAQVGTFTVPGTCAIGIAATANVSVEVMPVYKDANAPIEDRIIDLLGRMTLQEKAAQMVQGEIGNVSVAQVKETSIGSILSGGDGDPPTGNGLQDWYDTVTSRVLASYENRLGIPIIYGIDAVHGHSNVIGAVIFPHNIGLGAIAAGNEEEGIDIVKRIGAVTAQEMSITNIPWTFSPCLADPQNVRWGRSYEGFSDNLDIVAKLGVAYVQGLQGDTIAEMSDPEKAAACVKHYIGEGWTDNGANAGNITTMTKEEVAQKLIKPYADAVAAGARTLMPSYHSIQGVKMHGSKYLLTDILKNQLGFDGFVISDYNAVSQINLLEDGTRVSGLKNCIRAAVNAGVDMLMQPSNWAQCIGYIVELAQEDIQNPGSGISMERIDDAVSRILRVKFQLGLFDNPIAPDPSTNPEQAAKFGSAENRALGREAVAKSLVLLKNDIVNGRPIMSQLKNMEKIFVAGKSANNIGNQCGGWTIRWQGQSGNITIGTTILEGLQAAAGENQTITFSENGTGAEGHDVAIVVIGETPYAEGTGDNRNNLRLDNTDLTTLNNVKAAGIPIVVVLVSGRPMIIADQLDDWDALVAAWLPGTEGDGVADVLLGDQDFVGRTAFRWPISLAGLPYEEGSTENILFDFGYGLTKDQSGTEPFASLSGPSEVNYGQSFSVNLALTNVPEYAYSADITLNYDADKFDFVGSDIVSNSIVLLETREGVDSIRAIFACENPIKSGETLIQIGFKSKTLSEQAYGSIQITDAKIGTAPDGGVIEAVGGKLNVLISEPDTTPPGEVSNVAVIPSDQAVTITWDDPGDTDLDKIIISCEGMDDIYVNKGVESVTIDGLTNGVTYTFTIKTKDKSGNVSAGVTVDATPYSAADINNDGEINVGDLAIVAYYYGVKDGDDNWNEAEFCDLVKDGIIDILDLAYVAMQIVNG